MNGYTDCYFSMKNGRSSNFNGLKLYKLVELRKNNSKNNYNNNNTNYYYY